MKKVKIEFNYPEAGEYDTTFSLTIDNMSIESAKELVRLPELIKMHYKEYKKLMFGVHVPSRQSLSDTQ